MVKMNCEEYATKLLGCINGGTLWPFANAESPLRCERVESDCEKIARALALVVSHHMKGNVIAHLADITATNNTAVIAKVTWKARLRCIVARADLWPNNITTKLIAAQASQRLSNELKLATNFEGNASTLVLKLAPAGSEFDEMIEAMRALASQQPLIDYSNLATAGKSEEKGHGKGKGSGKDIARTPADKANKKGKSKDGGKGKGKGKGKSKKGGWGYSEMDWGAVPWTPVQASRWQTPPPPPSWSWPRF